MPSATEDTDDSVNATWSFSGKSNKTSRWTRENTQHLATDDMDGISPLMLARSKEVDDFDLDATPRAHNPYLSKRPSRKRAESGPRSPATMRPQRQQTLSSLSDANTLDSDSSLRPGHHNSKHRHSKHHKHGMNQVLDEVVAWLQAEKAKQKERKAQRKSKPKQKKSMSSESEIPSASHSRRSSDASEEALDLQELESILERNLVPVSSYASSRRASSLALKRYGSRSSLPSRRLSIYKSSDTEVYDDELLVPSCDVVLDNSKTLANLNPSMNEATNENGESRSDGHWETFKYEIVRLSHTLKLTGWRQVSLEGSENITVERLSGALTNAVYVVTPPSDISNGVKDNKKDTKRRRKPLKLLLRIYGPNVEHLIDREAELRILKRLARKQIGPRLLGTFRNGRFEEYLHARPLRPQEMRDPDTSKQIAKRMRELHDGIELLTEERLGGPFIWRNWDKWLDRAEGITMRLDSKLRRRRSTFTSQSGSYWVKHGFVCGTSWNFFRSTVEQYRRQLDHMYGSKAKLRDQLVFAHNDTQYGNILRIEPPGESPLLLPANQHKQLVVIDFEYSNANVPGIEFANHFTEWCYNYHDPTHAFACNTKNYPTLEEQRRFIRAYVVHQPEHTPAAFQTPRYTPMHSNASLTSISELTLGPSKSLPDNTELDPLGHIQNAMPTPTSDASVNAEIERLTHEARMWRVANSAQWVIWGILQATLPDDLDELGEGEEEEAKQSIQNVNETDTAQDSTDTSGAVPSEEHAFDYLSYARERAMFFWGDCLQFGLVSEDDLGEAVMRDVKIVPY